MKMSKQDWEAILAKLRANQLVELNLEQEGLTDNDMELLADAIKNAHSIQRINLFHQYWGGNNIKESLITDKGAIALANVLQHLPALKHLNLHGSTIGTEGTKALAAAFVHIPALEHLDLSWNEIGVEGFEALSKALQYTPSLRGLGLGAMPSDGKGNQRIKLLAAGLKYVPFLEELELRWTYFGLDGMLDLTEAFNYLPFLKNIGLNHNRFDNEGVKALASVLPRLPFLEYLGLDAANMDSIGAKSLATGLQYTPFLSTLDLRNNQIDAEGIQVLSTTLQNSKFLTTCVWGPGNGGSLPQKIQQIVNNNLQLASQPAVSELKKSMMALKNLLREILSNNKLIMNQKIEQILKWQEDFSEKFRVFELKMDEKIDKLLPESIKVEDEEDKLDEQQDNLDEQSSEGKIKNLVFEGGGVKGIAYLGALKELSKKEKSFLRNIKRVGGTSVGAITALLVGLGYTLEEIEKDLKSLDFSKFLDGDEEIRELFLNGNKIFDEYIKKKTVGEILKDYPRLLEHIESILNRIGYDLHLKEMDVLPTIEELSTKNVPLPLLIKTQNSEKNELLFHVYGISKLGEKKLTKLKRIRELNNLNFNRLKILFVSSEENNEIYQEIISNEGHHLNLGSTKLNDPIFISTLEKFYQKELRGEFPVINYATSLFSDVTGCLNLQISLCGQTINIPLTKILSGLSGSIYLGSMLYIITAAINHPPVPPGGVLNALFGPAPGPPAIALRRCFKCIGIAAFLNFLDIFIVSSFAWHYYGKFNELLKIKKEIETLFYSIKNSQFSNVLLKIIDSLQSRKGIFEGKILENWFEDRVKTKTKIEKATFQEIQKLKLKPEGQNFKDMYFTGLNIVSGKVETFSHETNPDMVLSNAVRISMSIPILFIPQKRQERIAVDSDLYVDAGIVKNYPVDLFDYEEYIFSKSITNYETLGLKLVSDKQAEYIWANNIIKSPNNFNEFVLAILSGFYNQEFFRHVSNVEDSHRTIYINTLKVSTIDFGLTDSQKDGLQREGCIGAKKYLKLTNFEECENSNQPNVCSVENKNCATEDPIYTNGGEIQSSFKTLPETTIVHSISERGNSAMQQAISFKLIRGAYNVARSIVSPLVLPKNSDVFELVLPSPNNQDSSGKPIFQSANVSPPAPSDFNSQLMLFATGFYLAKKAVKYVGSWFSGRSEKTNDSEAKATIMPRTQILDELAKFRIEIKLIRNRLTRQPKEVQQHFQWVTDRLQDFRDELQELSSQSQVCYFEIEELRKDIDFLRVDFLGELKQLKHAYVLHSIQAFENYTHVFAKEQYLRDNTTNFARLASSQTSGLLECTNTHQPYDQHSRNLMAT